MKNERKPRTAEEIKRQVDGLLKMKDKLPRRNFFGGDNHAQIDAQIAVLQGRRKPDDFYQDEHADDYEDGDNETWSLAEQAEQWLNGFSQNDLFE